MAQKAPPTANGMAKLTNMRKADLSHMVWLFFLARRLVSINPVMIDNAATAPPKTINVRYSVQLVATYRVEYPWMKSMYDSEFLIYSFAILAPIKAPTDIWPSTASVAPHPITEIVNREPKLDE